LAFVAFAFAAVPLPSPAQDAGAAIRAAYARLATALGSGDEAAVQAIAVADLTQSDPYGSSEPLAQVLAETQKAKQTYPDWRVRIDVSSVRAQGGGAVADVTVTEDLTVDGRATREVTRRQDRWSKEAGQWRLAGSQVVEETDSTGGTVTEHSVMPAPLSAGERAALVAQLRLAAWPIDGAAPSTSDADLAPLGQAIGMARIVGLGEATHGTSEFFALKDRIFRYLVERHGFTVLAMEANWSDSLAIERYVTTGQGDLRAALASTFAVWDNQETLDLLEWMRQYNAGAGPHPTLHFVGIDMQTPSAAAAIVVAAFAKARPNERAAVASEVRCMDASTQALYATFVRAPKAERTACVAGTAAAAARFDSEADALRAALTPEEFVSAQHAAVVVNQAARMYDASGDGSDDTTRDASMASNAGWVANALYPNARIALWAHDAHVMATPDRGQATMGTELRKAFGANYYTVGMAFYRGSISPNGVSPPMDIPPPPPAALEALFHAIGEPIFGLTIADVPADSPLAEYLAVPQPMRLIGAIPSKEELRESLDGVALAKAFDAVLFVDESHAAHSFQGHSGPRAPAARLAVPSGVAGIAGDLKWSLMGANPQSYAAGADTGVRHGTTPSLWLASTSAAPTEWAAAATVIPLDAYRGKRIAVRGFLKTSAVTGTAAFWVRVDAHGKTAAFDNMGDRPLGGDTDWKPFAIVLDVAPDAADCVLGTLLFGPGKVWADDVSIAVVGADVPTTGMKL
jgi:erythromycin esterase